MKERIAKLAEHLFLRYPHDYPEKLFKLAKEFLEYKEKYLTNKLPEPDPFGTKAHVDPDKQSIRYDGGIELSEDLAAQALRDLGITPEDDVYY